MVPEHARRPFASVLLAVLLIASGGMTGVAFAKQSETAAGAGPAMDAGPVVADNESEVVADLRDRLSSLDSVVLTRNVSFESGDTNVTTVVRLWVDREDGQLRREVVESAYRENVTTVRNDSTVVSYDADENTVTRRDSPSTPLLPTLSVLGNESAVDYEYRGDTTLNGERVHELVAIPQMETSSDQPNATLFVDADTDFPVRLQASSRTDSGNYTTTIVYENVSLNPDIPESRFEIDVPENATEPDVETDFEISRYDSMSELRSGADIEVPEPDLPQGFAFDDGRVVDSDSYYTVSATYTNGTAEFTLSTRGSESLFDYSEVDRYESVELGDHTGYYAEYDGFGVLHWECNDSSHTIYGDVSRETMVSVAASVACD